MDRRIWLVFAITVLFCIGMTVYYQIAKRNFDNSLPPVPTAVAPQGHEAPPGDTSHPHEEGTHQGTSAAKRVPDEDDRLTDEGHAHSHTDGDVDLWAQLGSPEDNDTADAEEPYPPLNWAETLDPALYAEYYYAQLLKQFGDVPDIETLADSLAVGKYKLKAQIPMTIDEAIAHAEASNTLWPNESTQRSIENLHEIKASGRPYNPTYGSRLRPPPDPVEHLKPILTSLTRDYGVVEGLRVLNTFDPQAAMEVKRAMIQDAETVGATTPGYYESKMKLIEHIFGDSDL